MKNRVLHVMIAEKKFVLSLVDFIINDLKLDNHKFLIFDNGFEVHTISDNVFIIKTPFKSDTIKNFFLFSKLINSTDKIILHNLSFLNLLFFFPYKWKNTSWVINGADLYGRLIKSNHSIFKKIIIRLFDRHITHIEGDSRLANEVFGSNAKFHYSPMYLSNVVSTISFKIKDDKNKNYVLLVGNSLSKNNNHLEVLKKLQAYEKQIDKIICPLSYGNDLAYRNSVIDLGIKLFGERFHPLTEFMPRNEYEKLLDTIDIAIFDHWRQEAMGVTLSLLSLGKTVYMRSTTESFKSLVDRGFKVFDNQILFSQGIKQQDVNENLGLLEKYYGMDTLKKSIISL